MDEYVGEVEITSREEPRSSEEEDKESIIFDFSQQEKRINLKPGKPKLVVVRGPIFDIGSAAITMVLTFAVVINYLIMSERVDSKVVPFMQQKEEAKFDRDHQREINFPNCKISSHFDSGNLRTVKQSSPYEFEIKVGGESKSARRRWFYFKMSNIKQPVTMRFFVSNITLETDFLQNGVLPVYKSISTGNEWVKLETITRIRQIDTNELEVEFSYQYDPRGDGPISFALDYPFTYKTEVIQEKRLSKNLKGIQRIFFELQNLAGGIENSSMSVILLSSHLNIETKSRITTDGLEIPGLKNEKAVILILARIHGYETLSSYAVHRFVHLLTKDSNRSKELLDKYLFVILPMMNGEGVKYSFNVQDANGNDMDELLEKNSSIETSQLKSFMNLVKNLNVFFKLRGFFSFRSSLNSNQLSIKIPKPITKQSQDYLILPYQLNETLVQFDIESQVSFSSSNSLINFGSGFIKQGYIARVDFPTMKKSSRKSLTYNDIETAVDQSSSLKLSGFNKIVDRFFKAFYKVLIPSKIRDVKEYEGKLTALQQMIQNSPS